VNHFESLWAEYYAPHLTKIEIGQLRRSETAPPSVLLTDIIQKQGFDSANRTYMGVESNFYVKAKSHYTVASLIERTADHGWEHQCLFTNAMRIAEPGEEASPASRIVVAPHHILTIEFDDRNIDFFQQQLGWLRSSGGKHDSVVGQFVAHLRKTYADVAGLTVVYSGHKSLHFHFVVSTEILRGAAPEPTSARLGFEMAWDRLRDEFENFAPFKLAAGKKADITLRRPENYRRLPGGMRLNDSDHIFGVPAGEPLFQGVMWEHLPLVRGGGGKGALLNPVDFMTTPILSRRSAPPAAKSTSLQNGENLHAEGKLADLFDGVRNHPKFSHIDRSNGEPVAYFYNHPADQNPTSVMRADFATVLVQGANPLGLTNDAGVVGGVMMSRLPRPLGDMLDIWSDDYHRQRIGPGGRVRSTVEAQFAEQARDHKTATEAMSAILLGSLTNKVRKPETHLLCAPEGISKTRSLMTAAPDLIANLRREGLPSWLMFAFPTYEGAEEKAEEFRTIHAANLGDMKPVVLRSFDRIYCDLCPEPKTRLSHKDAAMSGYASRADMIRTEQISVAKAIDGAYADLRSAVASGSPVFFTVHDVAQAWAKDNFSRLLLAAEAVENPADRLVAREATRLGLLVHDEINTKAIVEVMPSEKMEGIRELITSMGWTSRMSLAERWSTFQRSGRVQDFDFDEVCRIAQTSEESWEQVTTGENFEYGASLDRDRDIYGRANNRRWHVRRRNWASEVAHKTAILTTEYVPLILAEHAGSWRTTCLDAPHLPKDLTSTRPARTLTTRSAARHVLAARADASGPLRAIGNRLKHLDDAETHASAKGSNDYIGEDIVQTMTMMAPEHYAEHQALNAWTGRVDLARIAHIDQFNQTAGRNLGFRSSGRPSHQVLINRRLFDSLTPVLSYARYDMTDDCVEVSRKLQRRKAQKAKGGIATGRRCPKLGKLVEMLRAERRGSLATA
jgi:hypothetical protein